MGWFSDNASVSGPNGEVLSGGGVRTRPGRPVSGSDGSQPTANAGTPISYGSDPAVSYPEAGSNYSGGQVRPTTGSSASSGAASSSAPQYSEQWFRDTFGTPGTPDQLIALESRLNAQGIKVLRNAAGVAGKIQLPNGQIVDVINSAGLGGRGFQWGIDDGGGSSGGSSGGVDLGNFTTGTFTGGGQYPLASVMGTGLMQPWTTPFNSQQYNFTAPTDVTQQNDPGFQFRLDEGLKAIQRSAAAKGTLLTGGTLKDAMAFNQDLASNEYGNVYNRALQQNELAYNRGLQEYMNAYNIYNNNQNTQYGRLSGVASLGQNAAAQSGNANTGYANQASNTLTGIGASQAAGQTGAANATAAGQAASGSAWGNAAQNLANTAGQVATYYGYGRRPTTGYDPYGNYS